MKRYPAPRRSSARPWRFTRRGRRVVAVVSVILSTAVLVLAYQTGQDARCDALTAAHDPAAARYCQ